MIDPFDLAAGWLQEHLLIPLLYALGLMQWEDISYGWALFAVYGAVQVASPSRSACRWNAGGRWSAGRTARAVAVDVLYTVISRVGVLPLVTFVLFYQAQVALNGVPDRSRLGAADAGAAGAGPARPAGADLLALRDHPRLRRLLAAPPVAIGSTGGGRCTRCTTRSGR